MTKNCKVCGREFEPVNFNHKYCSDECRLKQKQQYRRRYYQDHKEFFDKYRKEWYSSLNEAEKQRLRNQSRQWRKNNPEKVRMYRHKYKLKKRVKVVCPVCGKEFKRNRRHMKYCSDNCKQSATGVKNIRHDDCSDTFPLEFSDIVPPECLENGQVSCLECSRKRCIYE